MDNKTHQLSEYIDVEDLRDLMQAFYDATRIPVGICDTNNNWLVALGWVDICVKFHRSDPVSCQNCIVSDRYIEQHLHEGRFVDYQCLNGLVDVAFPIIVANKHLATFFIGQFLYQAPDKSFFRKQGERYGYDLDAYMKALDEVQIVSEARVTELMNFFMRLVALITRLSHENLGRKIAEGKFAELNKKLEASVAERTHELEVAMAKLEILTAQDVLTSAANRRQFEIKLQQEIERVRRYDTPLSLIMLDLDWFKKINDTYGHAIGDEVLKDSARLIQRCLRQNDLLARWGGEEFTIVLPSTTLQDALVIAERIRNEISRSVVIPSYQVTCSLGVAEWSGDSSESLVKKADTAMYVAKTNGRNRIETYM